MDTSFYTRKKKIQVYKPSPAEKGMLDQLDL
jgi:hypothetical protein